MAKSKIAESAGIKRGLEVIEAINQSIEQDNPWNPRKYLGASGIGQPCTRALWYQFRHAHEGIRPKPAMRRLWERGHLEEPRIVKLLRRIGCTVYTEQNDNEQFGFVGYRGHYKGHIDGVVIFPDDPDAYLLECKTHNDASFKNLIKEGVQVSKKEHYWQMQSYMLHMRLTKALYIAVNKNNDELHLEFVEADADIQTKTEEKAMNIINAPTPPMRVSHNPGWYICRWCDFRNLCHSLEPVQVNKSCRTCTFVVVCDEGKWGCTMPSGGAKEIPVDIQELGCEHWDRIDMVQ